MNDIDGGVAAVTASLGHCFISIQQFTVWQLFVATLLSFNVERYSDVRATSDEESDLSEFYGYTMASDELESLTGIPWKLRLRLSDEKGRGMQVHSRMSEEYLGIEPGMDAVGVLLSTSRKFDKLAGMTDFCILDKVIVGGGRAGKDQGVAAAAVAWVGDYPYLDKDTFLRKLNENGISDRLLLDLRGDEGDYDKNFHEGKGNEEFDSRGEKEEYINLA